MEAGAAKGIPLVRAKKLLPISGDDEVRLLLSKALEKRNIGKADGSELYGRGKDAVTKENTQSFCGALSEVLVDEEDETPIGAAHAIARTARSNRSTS